VSDGRFFAEALEQLFTSPAPGWFTPFVAVLEGLSASQAATVPAERFNSIWAVVNHVAFWQEAALCQLQGLEVDYPSLGSADGSGWPPVGSDEAAWQSAQQYVKDANRSLAQYVSGLSKAELDQALSDSGQWNTRRHLIQSMIAHNSYHTCELITIRHMQGLWFDSL
jgi:uncharacterized damage-inducible protein DinB